LASGFPGATSGLTGVAVRTSPCMRPSSARTVRPFRSSPVDKRMVPPGQRLGAQVSGFPGHESRLEPARLQELSGNSGAADHRRQPKRPDIQAMASPSAERPDATGPTHPSGPTRTLARTVQRTADIYFRPWTRPHRASARTPPHRRP
jgi:hypothetical protein